MNRRESCTPTVTTVARSGTSAKALKPPRTHVHTAQLKSAGKRLILGIIASLVLGILGLMPLLALIGKAWLGFVGLAVLCVAGLGVETLKDRPCCGNSIRRHTK